MDKNILKVAIAAVLGSTAAIPVASHAVTTYYDWSGVFTMLDAAGAAVNNTSTPAKGNNQYQTPVSGTMAFDTASGAGTATLVPFNFFSGVSPVETISFKMQAIGDGAGGPGTLILGNMLFNWSGNGGIPVSIVLDARGFFTNGVSSAIPASDGTYIAPAVPGTVTGPGGYAGYLGLGPIPIATTAYNTTNSLDCDSGCESVSPSGVLPLVIDTDSNIHDYVANTGGSIGGSPIQTGPFSGWSANFDIMALTFTGSDSHAVIQPPCEIDPSGVLGLSGCPIIHPPVPVPAAVWLFGSGLLGLIGVARRRQLAR